MIRTDAKLMPSTSWSDETPAALAGSYNRLKYTVGDKDSVEFLKPNYILN